MQLDPALLRSITDPEWPPPSEDGKQFDPRDDDLPRLIAADWLQDHGDDERAELIRVQCELATLRPAVYLQIESVAHVRSTSLTGYAISNLMSIELEDLVDWRVEKSGNKFEGVGRVVGLDRTNGYVEIRFSDQPSQSKRRNDLIERQWELLENEDFSLAQRILTDFPAGFPRQTSIVRIVRGFVESIVCSGEEWLRYAHVITRAHPIRRVEITEWPRPVERREWRRARDQAEFTFFLRPGVDGSPAIGYHVANVELMSSRVNIRRLLAQRFLTTIWPRILFVDFYEFGIGNDLPMRSHAVGNWHTNRRK